MLEGVVQLRLDHGVAMVTLNRPDFANALDVEMCEGIESAVAMIGEEGSGVRAILLRANGKNFCVGGDVRHMERAETLPQGLSDLLTPLHRGLTALAAIDVPLIIGVRGAAAGAGLSLLAMADYAVGAEDAKFVMAYSAIGLTPDGGATWSLPRVIGYRRTLELALTNRRLSAPEALSWGLLNELRAEPTVDERALEVARTIAQGPTAAFGATRRLLRVSAGTTIGDQLIREQETILAIADGEDAREGVSSLIEKRAPRFVGART